MQPYVTLPSKQYLADPGSATASSMFIGGAWRAAAEGGTRDVLNPYDASVLTVVSEGTAADA